MKVSGSKEQGRHSAGNRSGDKVFGSGSELPEELKKQLEETRRLESREAAPPRTESPAPEPVRRKKGRGLLKAAVVLLLLAAAAVAAYALWETPPETAASPALSTQVEEPSAPTPSAEAEEPGASPHEPEKTAYTRRQDCYTFVLAAMDQVGANTDTILVGRFDVGEGTLDLVNIPRDTLVNVSWGVKKVNTVLVAEGNDPDAFIQELSEILGFSVDCYAVVDIKAVEKLVDCIGGVYYTVPRNMDYDDPTQDLHVHISQGYQWLSGEDAVKVLRFRMGNEGTGYANGDLGRIATQQDFLLSIASQLLTLGNIPNLPAALDIFEEYVDTDLTSGNLAYFARQFLLMDKEKLRFATLPGQGVSIRGGSYYEIDAGAWVEMVNEYLNPYEEAITADRLDLLQLDSAGNVTATSGTIAGGANSFYDFYSYTG